MGDAIKSRNGPAFNYILYRRCIYKLCKLTSKWKNNEDETIKDSLKNNQNKIILWDSKNIENEFYREVYADCCLTVHE